MSQSISVRDGWPSAGIFLAPAAWAVNTQLNYAIVPWVCAHGSNIVPAIAIVSALAALASGVPSWRAWSAGQGASEGLHGRRPRRFVAGLGVLLALLFSTVILLQGAAGLVLQGCER
jgi:hypothetical protein